MSELLGLFYKVVRGRCVDYLRRIYRRREDLVEELPEVISEETDPMLEPDLAEKILAELSEEDRKLLVLQAIDGMTHRELSQRFQISRNTLLSRIRRMKQRLRARAERLGKVNL